jgi:hypothetical protein
MAAQLPDEEATIILSTPEPGAVVTSTKPAPNTGEPAKAEPSAHFLRFSSLATVPTPAGQVMISAEGIFVAQ